MGEDGTGRVLARPKEPRLNAQQMAAAHRDYIRSADVQDASHWNGGEDYVLLRSSGAPSNSSQITKRAGAVNRVWDAELRSYILRLDGGPTTRLDLAAGTAHRFLILELCIPPNASFSFDIVLWTSLAAPRRAATTQRRVTFSTSYQKPQLSPLFCKLPIGAVARGAWLSLGLDLQRCAAECFGGEAYARLERISIGACCRLRQVHVRRARERGGSEESDEVGDDALWRLPCSLPPGGSEAAAPPSTGEGKLTRHGALRSARRNSGAVGVRHSAQPVEGEHSGTACARAAGSPLRACVRPAATPPPPAAAAVAAAAAVRRAAPAYCGNVDEADAATPRGRRTPTSPACARGDGGGARAASASSGRLPSRLAAAARSGEVSPPSAASPCARTRGCSQGASPSTCAAVAAAAAVAAVAAAASVAAHARSPQRSPQQQGQQAQRPQPLSHRSPASATAGHSPRSDGPASRSARHGLRARRGHELERALERAAQAGSASAEGRGAREEGDAGRSREMCSAGPTCGCASGLAEAWAAGYERERGSHTDRPAPHSEPRHSHRHAAVSTPAETAARSAPHTPRAIGMGGTMLDARGGTSPPRTARSPPLPARAHAHSVQADSSRDTNANGSEGEGEELQAAGTAPSVSPHSAVGDEAYKQEESEFVDVAYDPVLGCYVEVQTGRCFELV